MADLNRTPAIARVLLVPAMLVFVSSLALSEVPDERYVLTDKKSDVPRATLDIEGETFSVVVGATCAIFSESSNSPEVGSRLEVSSNHPDRLGLGNRKGRLAQAQKDNGATVRVVTGSGSGQVTNSLLCEKAEVDGDVKTKKSPNQGSFEASGSKCVCDESEALEGADCSVFTAQVNQLVTDCQNDGSLKLSYDGGSVKRFKIKGKGSAFLESETPE